MYLSLAGKGLRHRQFWQICSIVFSMIISEAPIKLKAQHISLSEVKATSFEPGCWAVGKTYLYLSILVLSTLIEECTSHALNLVGQMGLCKICVDLTLPN